jgi:hypothetical protein
MFRDKRRFEAIHNGAQALKMQLIEWLRCANRKAYTVDGNGVVAPQSLQSLKTRAAGHHEVLCMHFEPVGRGFLGENGLEMFRLKARPGQPPK